MARTTFKVWTNHVCINQLILTETSAASSNLSSVSIHLGLQTLWWRLGRHLFLHRSIRVSSASFCPSRCFPGSISDHCYLVVGQFPNTLFKMEFRIASSCQSSQYCTLIELRVSSMECEMRFRIWEDLFFTVVAKLSWNCHFNLD